MAKTGNSRGILFLGRLIFLVSTLLAFAGSSSSLLAQTIGASVNGETATPVAGAGHDYIHFLSETVDPSSGQVSLRITPPMAKGRGLTIPFSITYNFSGMLHLDNPTGMDLGFVSEYFMATGTQNPGGGGWQYSYIPTLSASTWMADTQDYGDPE